MPYLICLIMLSASVVYPSEATASSDPYETWNRDIEAFNTHLDKTIIKPTTEGYIAITADPIRTAVHNAVDNLTEPLTILNDVLQAKFDQAIQDSARFIFNTTFGLFGLIDIATPMQLIRHQEDFGQTFAVWGWSETEYVNLPLLGASTVRDSIAKPLDIFISYYSIPIMIMRTLSAREALMPIEPMVNAASDRYIFIRDAYLQQRHYAIHDGQSDAKDQFKTFDFSESE